MDSTILGVRDFGRSCLDGPITMMDRPYQMAVCLKCGKKHRSPILTNEANEFMLRHAGHDGVELLPYVYTATALDELDELEENSSIKEAFSGVGTFDLTSANLTNSATAGWVSNYVDNTTNLYRDALVMVDFAAVNTAPASNSAIYMYAYGMVDTSGTVYTGTGAANIVGNATTATTLTFANVTSSASNLPLLGVVYYTTQDVELKAGPFSAARCFGGILPARWGVAMVNFSGMTLAVNSIKYIGIYDTVI